MESGNFILAGITTQELLQATGMAIDMKQKGILGKPCPDYTRLRKCCEQDGMEKRVVTKSESMEITDEYISYRCQGDGRNCPRQ